MPDELTFNATLEDIHAKSDTEKDGSRSPYVILKLSAQVPTESVAALYEMLQTGYVGVTITEIQQRLAK